MGSNHSLLTELADRDEKYIMSVFSFQAASFGMRKFNVMYESNSGLWYSIFDTEEQAKELVLVCWTSELRSFVFNQHWLVCIFDFSCNHQKYYNETMFNSRSMEFDEYWSDVYRKYIDNATNERGRRVFIIFCRFTGQNVIMSVNQELQTEMLHRMLKIKNNIIKPDENARNNYKLQRKCCVCKIETEAMKLCGRCGIQPYCSSKCQREDWPNHKLLCIDMRAKQNVKQWYVFWIKTFKN